MAQQMMKDPQIMAQAVSRNNNNISHCNNCQTKMAMMKGGGGPDMSALAGLMNNNGGGGGVAAPSSSSSSSGKKPFKGKKDMM